MSLSTVIICLIISLIMAFIATGTLRAQLKSVSFQRDAGFSKKKDSFKITERSENYLYRTVSKTQKPQNNK